jgi:hypothetical protein
MSWVVTGSEKTPVDPQFGSVSLLLHGDGADGSTTITDSSPSPKTVAAFGNAQISTAQSKFGGASIALDGTGDYLTVPSSTSMRLGSSDFTIEFWLYLATQGSFIIYDQRSLSTQVVPTIYTASGLIKYFVSANDRITGSTLAATTWHHIAVSRSGTSTKMFINGTQAGSTYTDTNDYIQNPVAIGTTLVTLSNNLNGYIDDLRITKGVARYTANFTPPTAPFPDI